MIINKSFVNVYIREFVTTLMQICFFCKLTFYFVVVKILIGIFIIFSVFLSAIVQYEYILLQNEIL